MKKFVKLFYDVREGEWMAAGLMFFLNFMLMSTIYFLKPARDSLFLTEIGSLELPYMYLLLAAVSIPVSIFVTKNLREHSARKVLQWSLLFYIINLLALRWVFYQDIDWIYSIFYIWVGIYGILVISQYWLYAHSIFNIAQSKRLFSLLNLGAILGAIAGSQASSILVSWLSISTHDLLYACCLVLAGCYAVIFPIQKKVKNEDEGKEVEGESDSFNFSSKDALKTLAQSKYEILIAGIIGFAMLVSTLVDFQFKNLASEAYTNTAELTSFLGTFYSGMSVAALLIQILLSAQIIERLGLSGSILARPAGILVGAVLFLFEPVLAVAVFMHGFDRATRYSIDKTGRELLFLPLPQHVKQKTKVFMDIFVDRLFRGLAGLLLLGYLWTRTFTVKEISYGVMGALIIWALLVIWARREYVDKFRTSLRKRHMDAEKIDLDLSKRVIKRSVKEMLTSENHARIIYVMTLLKNTRVDKVAEELKKLLNNPHSQIRVRALQLLQEATSVDATNEAKELVNDESPEVRIEAINYLCSRGDKTPEEILQSYLEDGDENLKYAAINYAYSKNQAFENGLNDELIKDILERDDEDAFVLRAQIAQVLGYMSDYPKKNEHLSTLLNDQKYVVAEKAIESIKRLNDDSFIDELIENLKNRSIATDIQKTLASYGKEYFENYKETFFDTSVQIEIRERIPGIFFQNPSQSSVNYLFDMLEEPNPRLRFQVIKALNKLKVKSDDLNFHSRKVREELKKESRYYFELLSVKIELSDETKDGILRSALKEKMHEAEERIFRLVGLLHHQQDIYGSYLGLRSRSESTSAASIEFLNNVINNEDKEFVIPIIDMDDDEEKLEKGKETFELQVNSFEEALIKILDGADLWLKVCAIFTVLPDSSKKLQERVKEAAEKENEPLVRETAEFISKRNNQV